ncbi:hypothetical protein [Psychrobacillus sp.]|uniref:hypothetical protein n=1 Tax=Psychrobacillus sp. TaxID=1871623 RepID=UPI0028BD192C|nr:hypothetical protein [Psychrobacillus sp.]
MSNVAILSLLPVIIMLVIAWLIFGGLKKVAKHISMNQRFNKGVIIVYTGLLLLAAVVYEFLPDSGYEMITQKEYHQFENENRAFKQAFGNNEVSKLDTKFLIEEWTQELEGDTFAIVSPGSDRPAVRGYVEWTDTKERVVEGKMYRTNLYMYGSNLKDKLPLLKMQWQGNELLIERPAKQEIKFYGFSNQLVSLSGILSRHEYGSLDMQGETYIYLKVPKHMNVVDELGFLLY